MSTMFQTGMINLASNHPSDTSGKTNTFTQVTYPTPFPEGASVIVIPMVQTYNGPDTPGLRIAEVTRTGFKIRMNELVAGGKALSRGIHTQEVIGYIAFTL